MASGHPWIHGVSSPASEGTGTMGEARRLTWMAGLLLAAPLVAVIAWLVGGGLSRSFGPAPGPSTAARESAAARAPLLDGFPPPEGDYPADRLHERVDGAADALRAAGCGRLLFWKIADPPAEMELLIFGQDEGAARVLAREAGWERTPGPGDEAAVGDQSVLFRRGRFYGRILGDPGAAFDPARLLDLARKLDSALQSMQGGGAS